MIGETGVVGVLAAADAVRAPLSELSRVLMHHESAMDVTVPGWLTVWSAPLGC